MCERVAMSPAAYETRPPWWQRRGPSVLVFSVIVAVMAIASVALWSNVSSVLPDLGKDQQGDDPWEDPIGVEKVGQFLVARIPDCAAAPVVRIELWDEDSKPYWEVSGPATPMSSFAIGITPEGFTEETPYDQPPAGAVLRLLVVRKVKGVAGVRYQETDLRTGYVASGLPISRYEVEDFMTGSMCGEEPLADGEGSSTTTSAPGA